jgi:predicted ATPase
MSINRFVILSGCSGGGKSTLLAALARRGHAVVPEPGRRIVAEETASGGTALPWIDMAAFARRAIEMALTDRRKAIGRAGWVFFDRGLIDAAAALQHLTGEPALEPLRQTNCYHRRVFLTPPWPEIYANDAERRHGLTEAVAEYERLREAYRDLGYETIVLDRTDVETRADILLASLPQ